MEQEKAKIKDVKDILKEELDKLELILVDIIDLRRAIVMGVSANKTWKVKEEISISLGTVQMGLMRISEKCKELFPSERISS